MSTACKIKNAPLTASGGFAIGCVCAVISALVAMLLPAIAAAATNDIANSLCNLTAELGGPVGKAVASIAVAVAGLMAMYGRASWGTVMVIAAGVALTASAVGVATFFYPAAANTGCVASGAPKFTCNGATASGNMFAVDTIAEQQGGLTADPTGNSCVQQADKQTGNCGIFSRALWMFNSTVGNVMGSMYCSFSNALKGPIAALLTLFVVVYGLMVLGGMAQFNLKDSGIMLFKFALVWAFATQAEWGIDIGYNFFINFAEQGSAMVIAAMPPVNGEAVTITSPDTVFESILNQSTGTQSTVSDTPVACTVFLAIIGLFLLMFMPILIIFLVLMIANYIGNFAKALLGYLTALVLISFLFVLAPFFLGFALFRTTVPLFEAWIKHLVAFSLQMVLMFGFMALLAMIPFAAFFKELLSLLHSYSQTFDFGPSPFIVSFPLSFCGICQYNIVNAHMVNGNFIPATISCIPHPMNFTGKNVTEQKAMVLNATVAAANLVWPPGPGGQKGYMLSEDYQYYVMSILNLFQHSDFVKFVVIQALALYFISRVAGEFMKKAPEIASAISELPIAAALGGGAAPGGIKINYIGLDSFGAAALGFKNSMMQLHINPLRNPKGFLRRLNPVNAAKDWGSALGSAFSVGRDKDTGAGTGILGAFLYGTYESGMDNQRRKLKAKAAKKHLDAIEAQLQDAINNKSSLAEIGRLRKARNYAQRKYDKMSMEMRGYMKRGILGDGTRGSSSLNLLSAMHSPHDESLQKIQRGRNRALQRQFYGRVLSENERGYYGFMKLPEGVSPGENAPGKLDAAAQDMRRVAEMVKQRLAALPESQLSNADKERLKAQIDGITRTTTDPEAAISQINAINMQT